MAAHGPPKPPRPAGGRYGRVLKNKQFRLLWFSQLCSAITASISQVVIPLFVYDLSASAGLLGAVFVAQRAAQFAVTPITGVVADRFNRRRIMRTCDLARASLLFTMCFTNEVWEVAAIAVLVSIATAFSRPAELATVPTLVPAEDLVPALSLSQVSWSITGIAGPALGGGIFSLVGPRPAFGLEVAVYLSSFLFLSRIHIATTVSKATGGFVASAWRDFLEGLRTVWSIPVVRAISGTEALWSLNAATLSIATVVFTEDELDLGNRAGTIYSLLVASISAGAVIGALIAHRVEANFGRARLMVVGYLGPLFLVPVIFTPPMWSVFILFFLLGFTDAWAVISYQSFVAEAVDDEVRGRVYATLGAIIMLGAVIASAVVGWSTSHLGASLTIALSGLIVGIGGPLLLILSGAGSALRAPRAKTA